MRSSAAPKPFREILKATGWLGLSAVVVTLMLVPDFSAATCLAIEAHWREAALRQAGGEGEVWPSGVINLERGALGKIKTEWHQQYTVNLAAGDVAQLGSQNALAGLGAALLLTHHAGCCILLRLARHGPVLIGFLQGACSAGQGGCKGRKTGKGSERECKTDCTIIFHI